METRSAKRKRLFIEQYQHSDHTDRISDLPDVILCQILSYLPIKSIAQTSILSKRFYSLWSSYPDLDFTSSMTLIDLTTTTRRSHYTNFISQVLTLHDKNSNIRILRFNARLSFSSLNSLIRHAVKQNVQELDIEVATNDYFNFPRSVVTSESLRAFKLKSRYPGFRLLPSDVMKDGFKSLQILSLSLVMLHNQPSLMDLFTDSSFPLLKKLNLHGCYGLRFLKISCRSLEDLALAHCPHLNVLDICCTKLEKLEINSCFNDLDDETSVKINAPKLKVFNWRGNSITESSFIENLNCLQKVSVGFLVKNKDVSVTKLRSISNFLSGLCYARFLRLENQCLEILSNKNYFGAMNQFTNLEFLELQTGFTRKFAQGLSGIFKNCPIVEVLTIKIMDDYKIERGQWKPDTWKASSSSEEEQYWESQVIVLDSFLQHLKVVEIQGFLECENEICLAKFLLKHGKVLEEMTLGTRFCNAKDYRRHKIRSQMMGFEWASSKAKITFQSKL